MDKTPTAILIADLHLMEETPLCRTGDFMKVQEEKLTFLKDLNKKIKGVPILCSGDVFHKPKPSPYLLAWAMKHLPHIYTIPGNHDLPNQSNSLYQKSGLNVLETGGDIYVFDPKTPCVFLSGFNVYNIPWGSSEIPKVEHKDSKNVLIWHTLTYGKERTWEGEETPPAKSLLKKTKEFDLVLTGHNHLPFVEKHKGRLLVNPGSMCRISAFQINHRPRCYFWYADTNTVEPFYFPIDGKAVSREHILIKEARNKRLDSFITSLKNHYEVGLSFEKNIERFLDKNKKEISKEIVEIIRRVVWEEK